MTQPPLSDEEIVGRLDVLAQEHRELNRIIDTFGNSARPDQVQLARLKKRKLRLRDEIERLRDALHPDLIA